MLVDNSRSSSIGSLDSVLLSSHSQINEDERVIFNCVEYEGELLSKYFGESYSEVYPEKSACPSIVDSLDAMDDYQPTIDDFINPPLPPITFEDPFDTSCPLEGSDFLLSEAVNNMEPVEEEDVKPDVRPVPSKPVPAVLARVEKEKHRRGRPARAGSNSKMANYARQYREMKKNQLEDSIKQVVELEAENQDLRERYSNLYKGYQSLQEEVKLLRNILSNNDIIPVKPILTDSKKVKIF